MQEPQSQQNKVILELPEKIKQFAEFHFSQLVSLGIDADVNLIEQLYCKLQNQIFDGNQYFGLMDNQIEKRYELYSKQHIKASEQLFLIDHFFSFKVTDLRSHLNNPEYQDLLARLMSLLKYRESKIDPTNQVENESGLGDMEQEYDEQKINNPLKYIINSKTKCLSFYGNEISNIEYVNQLLEENEQLKIIWLNDNPLKYQELLSLVEGHYLNIEMLNSKFTQNVGEFAAKLVSVGMNRKLFEETKNDDLLYLDFEDRGFFKLESKSIQKLGGLFKNIRQINIKDSEWEFSQQVFMDKIYMLMDSFSNLEELIMNRDWEQTLQEMIESKEMKMNSKMNKINGWYINRGLGNQVDYQIRYIMENIWSVANSYRLRNQKGLDITETFYVMDEIGCNVIYNEIGNVELLPFIYNKDNQIDGEYISYSIMVLKRDIKQGEIISGDLLKGIDEQHFRSARLYPWVNLPESYFIGKYQERQQKLQQYKEQNKKEVERLSQQNQDIWDPVFEEKVRLFTDDKVMKSAVKSEYIEVVDNIESANIIYLIHSNIDEQFKQKHKGKLFNQFPFETCITMKNYIVRLLYGVFGEVDNMQTTYELDTELDSFMGEFMLNKQKKRDNLWIIKHINLARSMDMVVTDNLALIQKISQQTPRIAQKYIERPITRFNKKIDLRYIFLVKSVDPVDIYLYQKFWVRTANREFQLDERDIQDYETHFTVMNYSNNEFQQIYCEQWVDYFEQEYQISWDHIHQQIRKILKDTIISCNIIQKNMQDNSCRAMYGVDFMIDMDFKVKMLEISFSPDCIRANKFYPSFWTDCLECLYLGKVSPNIEKL